VKKSNKYDYFEGKQITDPDTGKRVYEINSYRLPSVTTILGATKNQQFLKEWKAKVGEQEAERIKNVSSARGTSMHKYLESFITDVGYDDLTELGQAAKPMAEKIMEVGLAPVSEYFGSEVTLHYPGLYAGQTELLLTSSRPIVRRRKNGSKIIIFRSQRTPWHTTMSTDHRSAKELSWYARLTYITKNLGSRTTNYGPGNTNF
jgi:hypothetical protein